MSRTWDNIVSWFWIGLGISRAAANDIGRHWVMASFSLVAGFGVWFAIQDVENPRVSQVVSFEAGRGIPIEARNVPAGYIFEGGTVRELRVEAREREIPEVSADDFEAWVDLTGVDPTRPTGVEIQVASARDGVRAIDAIPSTLNVVLVEAETQEFQVQVNESGVLPEGFELVENQTQVEPAFVQVTGTARQLASIDTVQIDVDLTGRRDDNSTFEGDLVARSSSGSPVTVTIDPPRAKVTLDIQQRFSQRTLPVEVPISGHPAPGYEIAEIVYEPESVVVSGPKDDLDKLSKILLDPVDIGGATTNVTQTRQVRISNTSAQPATVLVRVEIRRDECDLSQPSGCATATVAVAVTLQAPPAGLTYDAGVYMTQVFVTGPLATLQSLNASDFTASASLASGSAGTGSYTVAVVGPEGVRVDRVAPIQVTLRSTPP